MVFDQKRLFSHIPEHKQIMFDSLKQTALRIPRQYVTVFYPGCADDVLLPLLYTHALFDNIQELSLYFVDPEINAASVKSQIEGCTGVVLNDDEGILRSEAITVYALPADVFSIRHVYPEHVDLYFERAFALWREQEPWFTSMMLERLDGYVVSDADFFVKAPVAVHANLGFNGPMQVWRHG